MVAEFIRKWVGQPGASSSALAEAVSELERLGKDRSALGSSAALLRELLPPLFARPAQEKGPPVPRDQALARLEGGVPLLRGESLPLNARAFRRRWQQVCSALKKYQGGEQAQHLFTGLRHGRLNENELLRSVLAGQPAEIHALAARLGLDPGLTATVLRLVLLPSLAPINTALLPLREGRAWEHGYCPICGSWPLLGEFRGLEQMRFLRCGLCAAAWEFPRLVCPFCATRDHHMLGYFSVEGEETRYRASTCEGCRGYVKMVSTLAPLSPPHLLVADLATIHLDLAAAERGYVVAD